MKPSRTPFRLLIGLLFCVLATLGLSPPANAQPNDPPDITLAPNFDGRVVTDFTIDLRNSAYGTYAVYTDSAGVSSSYFTWDGTGTGILSRHLLSKEPAGAHAINLYRYGDGAFYSKAFAVPPAFESTIIQAPIELRAADPIKVVYSCSGKALEEIPAHPAQDISLDGTLTQGSLTRRYTQGSLTCDGIQHVANLGPTNGGDLAPGMTAALAVTFSVDQGGATVRDDALFAGLARSVDILAASKPPARPPVTRPSRPTGQYTTRGNRVIRLHWQAPQNAGGARILGYQAKRVGTFTVRNLGPDARATTFRRLVNRHRYVFLVRAKNRAGFSRWARVAGTPRPH